MEKANSAINKLIAQAHLKKYQEGGEVGTPSKLNLESIAEENKDFIRKFIKQRPSINQSYEDLINAIRSGQLTAKEYSPEAFKKISRPGRAAQTRKDIRMREDGSNKRLKSAVIQYPTGNESSIPHELLHYFVGHRGEQFDVPKKINPYRQLDMALRGYLPSFHPAGRRPTLPGNSRLANFWNERFATPSAEYSNNPLGASKPQEGFIGGLGSVLGTTINNPYNPIFDEAAFDAISPELHHHSEPFQAGKIPEEQSKPVSETTEETKPPESQQASDTPVSFDKNNYPIYNKQSNKAQSFRDAFRQARREGEGTFTWDGRLYTSELK